MKTESFLVPQMRRQNVSAHVLLAWYLEMECVVEVCSDALAKLINVALYIMTMTG